MRPALPEPDHRLVRTGEHLDVLGQREVPGHRAVTSPIETNQLGQHVCVTRVALAPEAPCRSRSAVFFRGLVPPYMT
jgi:hypothetical protein